MKIIPINKKLWLVFFSFFVLTLANFFIVRYFEAAQKTDGAIIDAAGRNRMLSQQLGFYAERVVRGNEAVRETLKGIIALHDVSFYALKDGGIAPEIAGNRLLPPTILAIKPIVQKAEELWLEYKKQGEIIVSEPALIDGAPNFAAGNALSFIEENAPSMLQRNNEMVKAYVKMNDQKQAQMNVVLFILLVFNVIIVGLGAWFTISITKSEELKAKDEAFLESIGDGLTVIDEDEKIIGMNKAAGELLGIAPDECIGKRYDEVFFVKNEKGENIPPVDQPMQIALTTGKKISTTSSSTITYYYVRKDETRFPAAITVTPVVLNNKIIGAIDVFRDITKDKDIDQIKSEFVSLASHQLRALPTSIKWFLDMLLSEEVGPLNEKQEEYFKEVYQNNQRMIVLINMLLDVSRFELGVFVVTPKPTDIAGLVREVLKEFELSIQTKKLDVKETYAPDLSLALVDQKLLRIVLQNIILNAVKYTPADGKINTEIFLKKKDENIGDRKIGENSLVVTVADTGYGIPKDQYDKIFTKFFRADNVREKDQDGTGLGLYLAKLIANHNQYDLWFESELGKGTVFYLAIPIKYQKKKE
ncbi:MAG: ATP-binding protein [Patescibacteria group bacterium]